MNLSDGRLLESGKLGFSKHRRKERVRNMTHSSDEYLVYSVYAKVNICGEKSQITGS